MFSKILIANRGEIALRIIRACREMGIKVVCVYSEADKDGPWLDIADEKYCIGPAPSAKSYLDISRIMAAAEVADVDAIHPGYGFLSENAHFAEVCQSSGISFIGPSPEAIRLLGNKASARELAVKVGVPLLPGTKDLVADDKEAIEIANDIGYPVIVKAAAGGGGRGMRVAHNEIALVNGFLQAKSEAATAFKDDGVYIEKFLERPRHVEIQIIADSQGNYVYCGERDCSLQRRHQKLVEEAPSPIMTPDLRKKMGDAAVTLCKAANYVTAGTAEFLVDKKNNFYFMEVNTRIQVEHPVSELVTRTDLIQAQIMAAAGEKLPFAQADVEVRGHAIEVRINAEDPDNGFRPSPGKITDLFVPGGPGVRWDSHIKPGYVIPPTYDSMIGKLLVFAKDRTAAIARMRRALGEFKIEGVKTTIPLHQKIMHDANFIKGDVDTGYIENVLLAK
ncbi:MAG: acetyl-CoA carboxylase biotin carboxylase subunit [Planctomycetes bacterium]|nr:acetyl-CoA carboxylase biotin carboxylase subunit [Planctomycetota bacterium]MCW8134158.1 acetyl-CoA carboxylase biotin carboxylase subunit [Planctomycetota bacterium]